MKQARKSTKGNNTLTRRRDTGSGRHKTSIIIFIGGIICAAAVTVVHWLVNNDGDPRDAGACTVYMYQQPDNFTGDRELRIALDVDRTARATISGKYGNIVYYGTWTPYESDTAERGYVNLYFPDAGSNPRHSGTPALLAWPKEGQPIDFHCGAIREGWLYPSFQSAQAKDATKRVKLVTVRDTK